MTNPREVLRECYGFALPDSFYTFWDLVQSLPEGEQTLVDAMGLKLAAPFDALRDSFDPKDYDPIGAARHYNDPPELFTIFEGVNEYSELHMGYWVSRIMTDSPDYMVAYHHWDNDFEINAAGEDIYFAVRFWLEMVYDEAGYSVDDDDDSGDADDDGYWATKVQLDDLRERLREVTGDDRDERGYEYMDLYGYDLYLPSNTRTVDGAGVFVPYSSYRKVSYDKGYLSSSLFTWETAHEYYAEGLQHLRDGFPGSALKIGRDLWCFPQYFDIATDLMMGAYSALGRDVHRWVVARYCRRRELIDMPEFWAEVTADEPTKELSLNNENLAVISPEIEQLPHLETLWLGVNYLSDLPDELAALTKLHRLMMPNNHFGKLPAVITQLENLRYLDVSQNVLGSLPPEMANLHNLEEFIIGHPSLTAMPPAICDIPNLKTLRLRGGAMREIPACIGKLKTLAFLDVYSVHPLQHVADEISACESLTEINYACYVNGAALPAGFCKVPSLKKLVLFANEITALPDAFDGLVALEEMMLGARGVVLPPSLFRLPQLKMLTITDYAFSELPPAIGQLKTLEALSLHTSILQRLPEEITQLPNLKKLSLQRSNQITEAYLEELRAKMPHVEING